MNAAREPFSPLRIERHELWILLAIVLVARVVACSVLPLSDEAFITFRYARNWAGGFGPVFNPGEHADLLAGTTSLGFAGLLAIGMRAGLDPTAAATLLGIVCDLASAWLLIEILDRRRIACGVALLAFALLPPLAAISAGGFESPLFTLLFLGALLSTQRGRWQLGGLLGAFATLLRPEGLLLLALLAGSALRQRADLRRFALPVLAIGVLALVWMLAVFGSVVPPPFQGPPTLGLGASWPVPLARAARTLQEAFCPALYCLPLLPLVLLGIGASLRKRDVLALFTLAALLVSASFVTGRVRAGEGWFHLALCAWCVWLGQGLERLVASLHARLSEDACALMRQRAIRVGGPLLLVVFVAVAAARRDQVRERIYAPLQARARAIGRVQPHARILASQVGALGWAWKGSVYDSSGRTWREAAFFENERRMIRECQPEYLHVAVNREELEPLGSDRELRAIYTAVARFSAGGATELEPDLDLLPQGEVQDFLLFRRRDFADGLGP